MINFGTGGFRGTIGEDFTKENIQLIAQAICNIIIKENLKKEIAIGYDYRFLSPESSIWMGEVFAANNIKALITKEALPTPAIMYATKELNNDFGIMITASHNPYLFNGIKVFQKQGMDADIHTTSKIEKELCLIKKVNAISHFDKEYKTYVKECNFIDSYISYIKKFISSDILNNNIKVYYDSFYGVGSKTIKKVAKEYKLNNIKFSNCKHDPLFGNALPNPTKENMLKIRNKVIKGNYAFAFGTDSDADRLGIIDELGNYVDSNEILACLYYYLVKYRNEKGDCVRNLATSILLDKLALNLNYKCHEVDVGFKNISSKMKETDALIGGESSGGLTIRNYIFGKDSTFSSCLFLEMVIKMNKPVSQIVKEVKEFSNYTYIIDEEIVSYDKRFDIKNYLYNTSPKFEEKPFKIEKIENNVKYHFSNNRWVLLRISGTEPVIRAFYEMKDKKELTSYQTVIKDYIKSISLETVK